MIRIPSTLDPKYGRVVLANKLIPRNTVIAVCELLVLSSEDTITVNKTHLKDYTFTFDKTTGQDCLVLGDGEIFNHGIGDGINKVNVSYQIINGPDRKLMQFTTTEDVPMNAQLFIDYAADVEAISADSYKLNLVG